MPATAPAPDMAPIEFLRAVMTGLHSLCSQGDGHPFQAVGFYTDPLVLLERAMTESERGRNVWFGVHPLERTPQRGRGRNDDVAAVHHLVADLDWHDPDAHKATHGLPTRAEVVERLQGFGPRPSIVVDTGHGLQAYWSLAEPTDPQRGEALTKRLHTALTAAGLVPDRHDLASVLRVPGTLNRKTSPPPLVRVVAYPPIVHRPGDLDDVLPALVAAVPPAPLLGRTPLAPTNARQPLDDDSIARWVDESIDWHQLLQADGWQFAGGNAEESRWTRPGKATRDGISAVLHEPHGPFVVFTTSVPMLARPERAVAGGAGWAYGPFGYIAATRHGGDMSAAAGDARRQRNADELRTRAVSTGTTVAQQLDAEAEGEEGDEVTDLGPIMRAIIDGTLDPITPTLLELT